MILTDSVQFVIRNKATGDRKYSCRMEEFRDLGYEELVNLKTGFTDYMRSKAQPQLKQGGVR